MSSQEPPFDDKFVLRDMHVPGPDDDEAPDGLFESDTQQIIPWDDAPEVTTRGGTTMSPPPCSRRRAYATVAVLLFVNLINYMDRFTVAGVLRDIELYYQVEDTEGGLLQTSFISSYMLLSPVFGYLGDRYNRKYLMSVGIIFWAGITLLGSFVPKHYFGLFLVMRGLVGVGEASYSTIAPTIIADLFVKDMRTKMLALFYFAIPVGSGLGYIVGTNFAKAFGHWQWALRFTPALGVISFVLILVVAYEPKRGQVEGGHELQNTSIKEDLVYLVKNKSFVLSTIGFISVAFVTGALAFFAPIFMLNAIKSQHSSASDTASETSVALKFGIITCAAGILGVGIGSETGRRLKAKYPNADPLVCAFGLISCSPFLFFALTIANKYTTLTWVLIFIGETLLCLNWAVVTDILLYVVIPTRRSTAEALQILTGHLLGDAGSPYLIGVVADAVRGDRPRNDYFAEFYSLKTALYMCTYVAVLGGAAFLATSLFVKADRRRADLIIKAGSEQAADSLQKEDGNIQSEVGSLRAAMDQPRSVIA